jgi:lipoyl(octanoyl) transferase
LRRQARLSLSFTLSSVVYLCKDLGNERAIRVSGFAYYDLGRIAFADALQRQTEAFDRLLRDKAAGKQGCNRLFFCEHPPVITLGKSGKETNLLAPDGYLAEKGISFYRINRGGDITFHGWGQITGYPVFDLEYWKMGLKQYVYTLEEAVIRFLRLYGVRGERQAGAAGVWLGAGTPGKARKICAIGVRSSRYVTMHGFALNINTDLSYFSLINPCGFTDKGVTSLEKESGAAQDFALAKERLHELFARLFPPARE